MAVVDYHGIKVKLAEILKADPRTSHCHPRIEANLMRSYALTPWVAIWTVGRVAQDADQRMAAGEDTFFRVSHKLLVVHHSLDGMEAAAKLRDEFMGKLEHVLMANRTIGGTVETLMLKGGEMGSGPGAKGFMADATLDFEATVRSIL